MRDVRFVQSTFYFPFLFPNTLYGLFIRWIYERNPEMFLPVCQVRHNRIVNKVNVRRQLYNVSRTLWQSLKSVSPLSSSFSHIPSKQPSLSHIEILVSKTFSVSSMWVVIVVHLKWSGTLKWWLLPGEGIITPEYKYRFFDLPFVLLLQIEPSSLTVCRS